MHISLAHFACARSGSAGTQEDSFSFTFTQKRELQVGPSFHTLFLLLFSHPIFLYFPSILCVCVALATSFSLYPFYPYSFSTLPICSSPSLRHYSLQAAFFSKSSPYTQPLFCSHHLKRVDILSYSCIHIYFVFPHAPLPSLPKEKKKEKKSISSDSPFYKAAMIRRTYETIVFCFLSVSLLGKSGPLQDM